MEAVFLLCHPSHNPTYQQSMSLQVVFMNWRAGPGVDKSTRCSIRCRFMTSFCLPLNWLLTTLPLRVEATGRRKYLACAGINLAMLLRRAAQSLGTDVQNHFSR